MAANGAWGNADDRAARKFNSPTRRGAFVGNLVQFPMSRHRIKPCDNMEALGDFADACHINGYALDAFAAEFKADCRRAVARLGEVNAREILKDVILSIQGEVS